MSRKSQESTEARSPQLYDVQETFLKAGSYLRNWGRLTQRTYRQAMQSLRADAPFLQDGIPTKSSLDGWVIALKQRGVSAGGINMYARAINSYLTWLHEEGKTPTRLRIKLLPHPLKPLTTFTDAEVKRLLHGTPRGMNQKRSKTLLTLLFDTGLRIGEAVGLEQQNGDFDNLMLRILGKGNRERIVPISPECRKALWRFCSDSKRQYVFGTRSGLKMSTRNAYRDLKDYAAHCGVSGKHVHPHAFRHYFAVTYLRNNGDLYRLSRILGHSNITTTSIYLRSTGIDQLREAHAQCSPLRRLA